MNFQRTTVGGRLGHDATFSEPNANGHIRARLSVATSDMVAGEEETNWHTVFYWINSEKEAAFLRGSLLRGATVLVDGKYRVRQVDHREYPIKVSHVSLEASQVEVVAPPRTASPTRQEDSSSATKLESNSPSKQVDQPVRNNVQAARTYPDRPASTPGYVTNAKASAPAATPVAASAVPMLQF